MKVWENVRYVRRRVATMNDEPSLTKQQFADETDVNKILERYESSGQLPFGSKGVPVYGDFSNVPDYQLALQRVREMDGLFDSLGARVRDAFGNDVGAFVEFMSHNPSVDALQALGLVPMPQPPLPAVSEPDERSASGSRKGAQAPDSGSPKL